MQMRSSEAVICDLVFKADCIPFLAAVLAGPGDAELKIAATHLLAALCGQDAAKEAAVCPCLATEGCDHKTPLHTSSEVFELLQMQPLVPTISPSVRAPTRNNNWLCDTSRIRHLGRAISSRQATQTRHLGRAISSRKATQTGQQSNAALD